MDVVPHPSPVSSSPSPGPSGSSRTRSESWRAWWDQAFRSVRNPNARPWYGGAIFGILFQGLTLAALWTTPTSVAHRVIATVLLVIFYAGFMVLPPLTWWAGKRERLIAIGVYFALSLAFLPLIGSLTFWLWVLVAVDTAAIFEEFLIVAPIVAVLVIIPLLYGLATGFNDSSAYSVIVIISVAAMMFGMNRQIRTVRELRRAQSEVARLAVVEERARFSRDMHDMLGHSLTVVTVKSELARRLVPIDPVRAESEVADIERLARSALADLRAAVAGYREMSFSTELAAAQATLAAAEIEAHLPRNGDIVDPELRELFGWVLREGVTNVIRHSGAKNCWVDVGRSSLTIADDGRGAESPVAAGTSSMPAWARPSGTGIDGLAARARAVAAKVSVVRSSRGGLELSVQKVRS